MTKRKPPQNEAVQRPDGTIPVADAAEHMRIDRATLWKWFMGGKVRGWRHAVNRRVYIFATEVDRLVREGIAADPTRHPR